MGPNEDYEAGYRSRKEARYWLENDAVEKVGSRLPSAERAEIDSEIEKEITQAVAFAEESPIPEEEDLHRNVFSG